MVRIIRHGSYSPTWLARDTESDRHVIIMLCIADAGKRCAATILKFRPFHDRKLEVNMALAIISGLKTDDLMGACFDNGRKLMSSHVIVTGGLGSQTRNHRDCGCGNQLYGGLYARANCNHRGGRSPEPGLRLSKLHHSCRPFGR
ncbi:hypothetical protein BO71DRAFT_483716 [Aspergillus ellipticus CBS 707.79]|uniref:Uncharacterized protein n=1 Tax=Aspergillus ellipticus CBS 707.79 TaxID=1448320 RepID=A0A319DB36_9EURO|nr:hypothetical protein BO71DRAFT_483716 [Aspergillus ellipticus CBS 707.79]